MDVGASIARPAVKPSDFADTLCKFVTFCRADGQWPPLHPKSNIYATIVQYRHRYVEGDRKGRPYEMNTKKSPDRVVGGLLHFSRFSSVAEVRLVR